MDLLLTDSMYNAIRTLYKKTKEKRIANYLNIILLKHKGYSQVEIAEILELDENTICTCVSKFEKSASVEEYLLFHYCPYVGKLPYYLLGQLDTFVENNTYCDTKPIIKEIKERFGVSYSTSGVSKLLKRLGFSYKEKVALPSKLDVNKQSEFVEDYEKLVKNLAEKPTIFFMDAVHPQHNTHTLKAWLRKGKATYTLTNSGRNRLNINGLYNPYTQEVLVTYHKTINAQAVIETFEKLKATRTSTTVESIEEIFAFADNAKYYVSKIVKDYLEANTWLKLFHLPPYSPNLNFIERLWKYVRKEVINPNYYEKFAGFTAAIELFFENIHTKTQELRQFIGLKFRTFDFP